jgi:hypothetical protein
MDSSWPYYVSLSDSRCDMNTYVLYTLLELCIGRGRINKLEEISIQITSLRDIGVNIL